MYTFCIVVILLASVSLIFVVLVQSPKGGMAANFGAANQVMGVRDAANGLGDGSRHRRAEPCGHAVDGQGYGCCQQ